MQKGGERMAVGRLTAKQLIFQMGVCVCFPSSETARRWLTHEPDTIDLFSESKMNSVRARLHCTGNLVP